jgi:hypothetical protein
VVTPVKRGKKLKADVPMEERLDNLSLTRQEAVSHEPPRGDSMAHLLMQVCMPWWILQRPVDLRQWEWRDQMHRADMDMLGDWAYHVIFYYCIYEDYLTA